MSVMRLRHRPRLERRDESAALRHKDHLVKREVEAKQLRRGTFTERISNRLSTEKTPPPTPPHKGEGS
jgi:RecB family exonuclease